MIKIDRILRITAADGYVSGLFADTHETVAMAQRIHRTTPVVTAALGRLLTAAGLMGAMMKNATDKLTIQIKSDGPIEGLLVCAEADGSVRGYAANTDINMALKPNGKLDVGGAVGNGNLTVVRDLGLKEPYIGTLPLVSGEIAEDIAQYFLVSEQSPSAVALGVLVDRDYSVKRAGGFVIRLLPNAPEWVVDKLEQNLKDIPYITDMMEQGIGIEGIAELVFEGLEIDDTTNAPMAYRCKCSRDRMLAALAALSRADLEEIIETDNGAELTCHFCNESFNFSGDELRELLR